MRKLLCYQGSAADYPDDMSFDPVCVFCRIVSGTEPADIVREWEEAVAFLPREKNGRRGCTDGHVLVVPRVHVVDAADVPAVTGSAARRAAEYAASLGMPFNLITSAGSVATQTVYHLHWHVVPRHEGDGLALPWTGGAR